MLEFFSKFLVFSGCLLMGFYKYYLLRAFLVVCKLLWVLKTLKNKLWEMQTCQLDCFLIFWFESWSYWFILVGQPFDGVKWLGLLSDLQLIFADLSRNIISNFHNNYLNREFVYYSQLLGNIVPSVFVLLKSFT